MKINKTSTIETDGKLESKESSHHQYNTDRLYTFSRSELELFIQELQKMTEFETIEFFVNHEFNAEKERMISIEVSGFIEVEKTGSVKTAAGFEVLK